MTLRREQRSRFDSVLPQEPHLGTRGTVVVGVMFVVMSVKEGQTVILYYLEIENEHECLQM